MKRLVRGLVETFGETPGDGVAEGPGVGVHVVHIPG